MDEVINFFSENYHCRDCFNNNGITINYANREGKKTFERFRTANVKGPQPRWIGKNYFKSKKRICFMLINPGSGKNTPDKDWEPLKVLSTENNQKEKENLWVELMTVNKEGMKNWGAWKRLYLDSFGLDEGGKLEEVGFMNKMLCAAWYLDKYGNFPNAYNQNSLRNCFKLNSHLLLRILSPKHLIFSGRETIVSILKKPRELSMSKVENSKHMHIKYFRESMGPKSRELNPSDVKDEIRDCLDQDVRYFFMGHYGQSVTSEDFKDAGIIKDQIGI